MSRNQKKKKYKKTKQNTHSQTTKNSKLKIKNKLNSNEATTIDNTVKMGILTRCFIIFQTI